MLNLITALPKYLSLGQPISPVVRISGMWEDLHDNSYKAYSPEFKRIRDWNNQYSFICDTNLNNLESQPRLTSGEYRQKQAVPK